VNQAFIEMSGFAEEELLGAPHITLVKTMGCWRGHQFDQPCRS
jgi:hypothetical protein